MEESDESSMLIVTARKGLYKLINIKVQDPDESDQYLFRWGVSHLLESEINREKEIIEVFSEYSYLEQKLAYQKTENFFDDLVDSYMKFDNKAFRSDLTKNFLNFIIPAEQNNILKIETLHSLLVYRQNQEFYQEFLQLAISETDQGSYLDLNDSSNTLYPIFLSKLANSQRRNGQISTARNLLTKSLDLLIKQNNIKELARVEYDIGYVYYLEGRPDKAYNHFEKSKNYATKLNDEIGYWISNCVQHHTGQFSHAGPLSPGDFKKVLMEALPVFKAHAKEGNENARRWVKNVYAHYFKVLFEEKNRNEAERWYIQLLNHPWMQKYGVHQIKEYKAMLAVLEERWEDAASSYSELLSGLKVSKESAAKDYLEYAKVLIQLNRYDESLRVVEIGLSCPNNYGNFYYKVRLESVKQQIEKLIR